MVRREVNIAALAPLRRSPRATSPRPPRHRLFLRLLMRTFPLPQICSMKENSPSLAGRFPELLSHCRQHEITVHQAYQGEHHRYIVTRQSSAATQATEQLVQVLDIIMEHHSLTEGRDRRTARSDMMLKKNGDLDTSLLYRALKNAGPSPDAWTRSVWNNKAPPRVKFFAWLLSQERIQCRTLLRRKGIVDSTTCEACQAPEETPTHIIFGCPNARQFWEAMQIHTEANWPIQALRDIQPPPHIPEKFFTTFLLLCYWHIWKRRNNIMFRNDRITLNAALAACKTEAHLWGARLPRSDTSVATTW